MKKKIIYLTFTCLIALPLLSQAQNIGIGTNAPEYFFTVKDSLLVGEGMGIAHVSPDGQVALGTYVSNGLAYIQTHTNTDLNFATNSGNSDMVIQRNTGNVGIGTSMVPAYRLEVSGHGKNGTLSYTDTAIGFVTFSDYENAATGIRGEYRGTGDNNGTGVMGIATTPNDGRGVGVTGKGNFAGVMGLGTTGGTAAIYAEANGATYGLDVYGNTYLDGNTTLSGTLQIQGGSPALGKVLTSNANGTASWQLPATPSIMDSIRNSSFLGLVDVAQLATIPSGGPSTAIPYSNSPTLGTTVFDYGNNLGTDGIYVAPSTGFYHFEWALSLTAGNITASQDGIVSVRMYLNNTSITSWGNRVYDTEIVPGTYAGSINIQLQAGDQIHFTISQNSGQSLNVNGNLGSRVSGYRVY